MSIDNHNKGPNQSKRKRIQKVSIENDILENKLFNSLKFEKNVGYIVSLHLSLHPLPLPPPLPSLDKR